MSAKLAHLGMIQGVITRLAGFSANAKNFCITIIAALVGISFQQHLPELLPATFLVVVIFALLDIYYLAQERRFRRYYKMMADRQLPEATKLDLSPSRLTFGQYWSATRSFSTGGFYLLLLIVTALILLVAYDRPEAGMERSSGAAGRAGPLSSSPAHIAGDQSADRERMAEQNRTATGGGVRELVESESSSTGAQERAVANRRLQSSANTSADGDVRPRSNDK